MPRATKSAPTAASPAPRVARTRKSKPPAPPLDPVLAGFARLKDLAPPVLLEIPPPIPESLASNAPPLPDPTPPIPATRYRWLFPSLVVLAVLIAVGVAARRSLPSLISSPDAQLAATACHQHAALIESEIIDALRTANDGTLTGAQALTLIEAARPVIAKHSWTAIANRLTELQDDAGHFDRAALDAFLSESAKGLRQCQ